VVVAVRGAGTEDTAVGKDTQPSYAEMWKWSAHPRAITCTSARQPGEWRPNKAKKEGAQAGSSPPGKGTTA
jgi:hypothetical protein